MEEAFWKDDTQKPNAMGVFQGNKTEHFLDIEKHLTLHEVKENPPSPDKQKVVEAFGVRKHPKLVEQLQMEPIHVKVESLRALCNELRNPYSVVGCVNAGVIKVLIEMIKNPEVVVRQGVSKAFSVGSTDANFRRAMTAESIAADLLPVLNDNDIKVRQNIYEALLSFSEPLPGAGQLVESSYPKILCQKSSNEVEEIKPYSLSLLRHCLKTEAGLDEALDHEAVQICIKLLSSESADIKREAAQCLSILCFSDMAKEIAITNSAVARLCEILNDSDWRVRAAAASGLMSVTTTDEGKKEIVPVDGVTMLMKLIHDEKELVALNTLKIIANVAVNPEARKILVDDKRFLIKLDKMGKTGSEVIKKHAQIADAAVRWMP